MADVFINGQLERRLDAFVTSAQRMGARGISKTSVVEAALEGFLDAAIKEVENLKK